MPKRASDMVAEAKAEVENLTPAQVAEELKTGALLVDLREPGERDQHGTIEGALHVPRGMLEFHADATTPYHKPEMDPSRRIILHCASGGRSALGARTLREMGYQNVGHMDGGYTAWKQEGRPTTTG